MALSSEEHALLETTCTNMNIAANTCREVLEMLRNLGNTGVVDIATHNNASKPHENATNLFHLATDGSAVLGSEATHGYSGWTGAAFKINSSSQYGLIRYRATKGASSYFQGRDSLNIAYTDSGGNLLSDAEMKAITNANIATNYQLIVTAKSTNAEKQTSINFLSGNALSTSESGLDNTAISFTLSYGTSGVGKVYEFNHQAFLSFLQNLTIGTATLPWSTAYFRTAATTTSDRREKDNIAELDAKAVSFIKALKPVGFTLRNTHSSAYEDDKDGNPVPVDELPGTRTHWGFVAQEVKEAMTAAGIEDAACWCLADKDNSDSKQSLRYEELIAPLVKAVQILAAKVEALEGRAA